jgi:hypothetical protein
MDLRLDDPDPRIRDLAYLLFLEEALGPEWVERWARERGKPMRCGSGGQWRGPRIPRGPPANRVPVRAAFFLFEKPAPT